MRPYLEALQGAWPWLLLAGLCGGIAAVTTAAAVLTAKRRYGVSTWLSANMWKYFFAPPERQPLIGSDDTEESKGRNYQTTM